MVNTKITTEVAKITITSTTITTKKAMIIIRGTTIKISMVNMMDKMSTMVEKMDNNGTIKIINSRHMMIGINRIKILI